LAVAASTWAFVNHSDWEERTLRVLRLVMDGLRYKPRRLLRENIRNLH
jgi:hypothetical protein